MNERIPKYKNHVTTAISAAKLSIEMFNRIEGNHSVQAAIVFNSQAWELLAKGILIRRGENIYNKDGSTITAEKALNILRHRLHLTNNEENKTIQQIVSLRNESLHGILPEIDEEIITHLLYFSLKTFHKFLKDNFKTYSVNFDKNYLAISFKEHTFYSHKVSKLLSRAKKFGNNKNKILYLLDRACDFAENESATKMKDYKKWKEKIKSLPKKSRVSRHLGIYKYLNKQEDVRFVPIEVAKGFKPEIKLEKIKNPLAPVLIKKTDPNIDFPHLTSDLATKLSRNSYFISRASRKLNIINNENYCLRIRTGKSNYGVPKYSDSALNYLKNYFDTHPDFNPYKRN